MLKQTEVYVPVSEVEFQVNKPNGDIDFITVYDLPESVARKFVERKYPDCKIELYTNNYKETQC
jgi:hypothetical protein